VIREKRVSFLFVFILFFSFCGERGPLIIKPLPIPPKPTEIKVSQRGNKILIKISYPNKLKNGTPLNFLSKILIKGYIIKQKEEETTSSTIKKTVFYEKENVKIEDGKFFAEFTPPSTGELILKVYSYNKKLESKSDEIKFTILESKSPPKIISKEIKDNKINFKWESEEDFEGFYIYKNDTKKFYKKLDGETTEFNDNLRAEEKTVYYLSGIIRERDLVETELSKPIVFLFKDKRPPSPPENIRYLVSPEGFLIIQWNKPPEKDIEGYLIFTSTNGTIFRNIPNDKPIKENKFIFKKKDKKVRTYYFYIIAVDKTGNKSKKSKIIKIRF